MKKILVAATSVLLATSVYANTEDHRQKFQEADTDGSGSISMEEARNAGMDEAAFNRHDTDGDGELSEQEFRAKKQDKKEGGAHDRDNQEYSR